MTLKRYHSLLSFTRKKTKRFFKKELFAWKSRENTVGLYYYAIDNFDLTK